MPYQLFPQTAPESLLRKINPSLGPACRTNWAAGHIERNRRIYDYELVFFSVGEGRVLIGDGVFLCRPGSVVIIPPGVPHCTVSETVTERWCIHFDWYGECPAHTEAPSVFVYMDEEDSFREELTAAPPPGQLKMSFPLFRQLDKTEVVSFYQQVQEFFAAKPESAAGELKRQGLFLAVLGRALEDVSPKIENAVWKNSRFLTAKNIIDSNFADPELNCTVIAGEIMMSTNHLAKLFRSMTGLSTQEYLGMRRMELARELLSVSSAGIAEIVEQCGFTDANYFSRYFRKYHGMSPTQFREKYSAAEKEFGVQGGMLCKNPQATLSKH